MIEVGYDEPVELPVPGVAGAGMGRTVVDVYPKTFTEANTALFLVPTSVLDADPVFEGFTVHGPTDAGIVSPGESRNGAAIQWNSSDSVGEMTVRDVEISGLFVAGVNRSGRGTLRLIRNQINAWTSPVSCFQSTFEAGAARCVMVGGAYSAYDGEVGSSIGIYIHPHIPLLAVGVRWEHFSRYGIYWNGTEGVPSHSVVADCEFHDCGIAQTASRSDVTFVRCASSESGDYPGTNGVYRGKITQVDGQFAGRFSGFLDTPDVRTYRNCVFDGATYGLIATGRQRLHFEGGEATVSLSRFLQCSGAFSGYVRFEDFDVYDAGASILLSATGGTIDARGGLTVHTNKSEATVLSQLSGATILGTIAVVPL